MMHIKNIPWQGRLAALILPALLVGGLCVGGCSNDPVGPHDPAPALSADDVASQAGFVAMAASIVAPETIEFAGKGAKNSYSVPFFGDVTGTVFLDFFSGGPGGTSVPWDGADFVNLRTGEGEMLVVSVGTGGTAGTIELTFDLDADLDRVSDPNTATVAGSGTYVSGVFDATFTFEGLVVESGGDYPGSGTMVFNSAAKTMTIIYDGGNLAVMSMSDGPTYVVNLDTGEVTETTPT